MLVKKSALPRILFQATVYFIKIQRDQVYKMHLNSVRFYEMGDTIGLKVRNVLIDELQETELCISINDINRIEHNMNIAHMQFQDERVRHGRPSSPETLECYGHLSRCSFSMMSKMSE